jgi:hypothetical protein
MEVSGLYPLGKRLDGLQGWPVRCEIEENLLLLSGAPAIQHTAPCYTDWAVLIQAFLWQIAYYQWKTNFIK